MKPFEVRELFSYNAWANQRLIGAVEPLSDEDFTKPMNSSFSSVRDTVVHIWSVEWIWLERLKANSPAGFPEAKQFPTLASMKPRWMEIEKDWLEYASRLDENELAEDVKYQTLSFGPSINPRWQMLQHVVNHSTYHRGQVSTLLRQLGSKSVTTDLIFYYRERASAAKA